MIEVTKVGDLVFEVRFAEEMREEIASLCGWAPPEVAIQRILSDVLLGSAAYDDRFGDGLYSDPFFDISDDGETPF